MLYYNLYDLRTKDKMMICHKVEKTYRRNTVEKKLKRDMVCHVFHAKRITRKMAIVIYRAADIIVSYGCKTHFN